jgi:hypothetical protein
MKLTTAVQSFASPCEGSKSFAFVTSDQGACPKLTFLNSASTGRRQRRAAMHGSQHFSESNGNKVSHTGPADISHRGVACIRLRSTGISPRSSPPSPHASRSDCLRPETTATNSNRTFMYRPYTPPRFLLDSEPWRCPRLSSLRSLREAAERRVHVLCENQFIA